MKRTSGFTLIELLVTITVLSVLISAAVPSFKTTIQNGRLVGQANDFLGAMLYARTEAISLNRNIKICASSDQAACSANPAGWNQGWIITTLKTDGSIDSVLRVHDVLEGNNTLTNDQNVTNLVFGAGKGMPVSSVTTNFSLCDSRGASFGRSISVNAVGETKVSRTVGKKLDTTTTITC